MLYKVIIPYDPVWTALDWTKKHCRSYYTNDAVNTPNGYYVAYYFGDEEDATLFRLRWC
jgi:hypothetical protein